MEEVERRYVARVMEAVAGNKTLAARILGFDRKTLYRKLDHYAVTTDDAEADARWHAFCWISRHEPRRDRACDPPGRSVACGGSRGRPRHARDDRERHRRRRIRRHPSRRRQ